MLPASALCLLVASAWQEHPMLNRHAWWCPVVPIALWSQRWPIGMAQWFPVPTGTCWCARCSIGMFCAHWCPWYLLHDVQWYPLPNDTQCLVEMTSAQQGYLVTASVCQCPRYTPAQCLLVHSIISSAFCPVPTSVGHVQGPKIFLEIFPRIDR